MQPTSDYTDIPSYAANLATSKTSQNVSYFLTLLYERLTKLENVRILKFVPNVELSFFYEQNGEVYLFEYDKTSAIESTFFTKCTKSSLGMNAHSPKLTNIGPLKGCLTGGYTELPTKLMNSSEILGYLSKGMDREEYFAKVQVTLNAYFQDRPDCEAIIETFLAELEDEYFLNLILANPEYPLWSFVEYPSGRVEFLFTNEGRHIFADCFDEGPLNIAERKYIYNDAKKLMRTKLLEYPQVKHIIDSLWVLKKDQAVEIFKRMKDTMNCSTAPILMTKYTFYANDYLTFLMGTLGLNDLPVSKDIDLNAILSMSNPAQFKEGEIAITIITPVDVCHAISIEGYLKHHEDLFADVYRRLYGLNPIDIRMNVIEIHHICYTPNDRRAILTVPHYITAYEFDVLTRLLTKLYELGVEINAKQSGYNPINGSFLVGEEQEFEGLEILDHLKDGDFIVDYDWTFKKVAASSYGQEPKI